MHSICREPEDLLQKPQQKIHFIKWTIAEKALAIELKILVQPSEQSVEDVSKEAELKSFIVS